MVITLHCNVFWVSCAFGKIQVNFDKYYDSLDDLKLAFNSLEMKLGFHELSNSMQQECNFTVIKIYAITKGMGIY